MIRLTGMNSGLDTDSMVKELVNAYEKKGQKTKNAKTKHEWKTEIWKDLNKKVKAFNSKIKSMQFSSSYSSKKTTSSAENKVSVVAGDKAVKGTQSITVDNLAKTAYLTGAKITKRDASGNPVDGKITESTKLSELGIMSELGTNTITVTHNGKSDVIEANKDITVGEFVNKLKASGLEASFDEKTGRMFISSKDSGEDGNFEFSCADPSVISKLGLTGGDSHYIEGENARIHLNGVEFESSSNSFDINGLAISVKGVTDRDEVVTLTTDVDTDAIYKNIKSIVSEYSKLMNELSKLYNADSARKFDPLTDEEKDAMTDDEVEKWETKIKDSLLRRDGNVASIMSAMKNSTMGTYTVGGTKQADGTIVGGRKLTLADFGIGTPSYFAADANEKSALHIDGDEDDESVSGKTNKLKQMIASDPDTVADFFSQLMTDMSDQFNKLSTSTTNRSYGNFYDDKKVKEDMSSYEKKVADFETYLAGIEDKYYKQFTQMEKAMAKLNSTQQQLGNYFG